MDMSRDPHEYLASGDAWADYCEGIKAGGQDLFRENAPKGALDLAEGHRYLARMVRFGLEHIMEGGDPRLPVFFPSLSEVQKSGWDNPDNHHTNAYINGNYEYRVWGRKGDNHYMSFAVYGGSIGREGGRRTVAYKKIDDLEVDDQGRFEVILSQREQEGNWIPLAEDATTLMVRETFSNKLAQERSVLNIECLSDGPPPELTPDFVVNAFRRSIRFMRGSSKTFFDIVDAWVPEPNVFQVGNREQAESTLGIPDQLYNSGWWEVAGDEALIVDMQPPECRYWSLALCDYWGASFDYRYFQINVNNHNACVRSDGSVRIIIAHKNPGLADTNWLDTAGHDRGVWTLRWMEAAHDHQPTVRRVPFDELKSEAQK